MTDNPNPEIKPEATAQDNGDKPEPKGTKIPPELQPEIDRIVQGAKAQVARKYADYDDLKAKAAEYDKFKDSQLSETEKAIKEAREEAAREVTEKFTNRLLRAEVKSAATRLAFHDPADALAVLDDTGKYVKGDGEIDTDAVSKALTALAETKPYLVAGESGPRAATRPKPRQSTETVNDPKNRRATAREQAVAALRQRGRA